MPKLLVFAPCEKVAFTQESSACLLGLLQGFVVSGVTMSVVAEAESKKTEKKKPSLPLNWVVFTLWRLAEAEQGTIFEQSCQLITPSGRVSFDQPLEFGHDPKEFQRNTTQVSGFPMDEEGEYSLKLFIGEKGKERQEIATYPVTVKLEIAPVEAEPDR